MARKLSAPMIEALSHIVRHGQVAYGAVASNTLSAMVRHGYYLRTGLNNPTQITVAGWSALPTDVRSALLDEMCETAIAQREMERELLATPVDRVDAAYRARMAANRTMPYVHADYVTADAALDAELLAFTNGDQAYAEALREALMDSGEDLAYYLSTWTRDELVALMDPYVPTRNYGAVYGSGPAGSGGDDADHADEESSSRDDLSDMDRDAAQSTCAHPGDQEHDHEMCRDAALDAPAHPLGTYTVPAPMRILPDVDLWDGKAQTDAFLSDIRAQHRSADQEARSATEIKPGTVFDTPFEKGCVAQEVPNAGGGFVGIDSEGVECMFSVVMVVSTHQEA